jgi:hypothetical protein
MVDALLPTDIQQLRVDLIATRAVSTVNHYLATFLVSRFYALVRGQQLLQGSQQTLRAVQEEP